MIKLPEIVPEDSCLIESVFVLLNPVRVITGDIAPSAVCDICVYVKVLVGYVIKNELFMESDSEDLFML